MTQISDAEMNVGASGEGELSNSVFIIAAGLPSKSACLIWKPVAAPVCGCRLLPGRKHTESVIKCVNHLHVDGGRRIKNTSRSGSVSPPKTDRREKSDPVRLGDLVIRRVHTRCGVSVSGVSFGSFQAAHRRWFGCSMTHKLIAQVPPDWFQMSVRRVIGVGRKISRRGKRAVSFVAIVNDEIRRIVDVHLLLKGVDL